MSISYSGPANNDIEGGRLVVDTTLQLVVNSDAHRSLLRLYNEGAMIVYVGSSSLTPDLGWPIMPGTFQEIKGTGKLYARVVSGTANLRYLVERKG